MTLYHINDTDKVSKKSNIRQLVDILQVDIASKYEESGTITQTHTRKKYEVFVTGGQDTSGTVTWPASVKFPADTAPTLTTGKTHLFMFVTDDGGTRYRGAALADYVN